MVQTLMIAVAMVIFSIYLVRNGWKRLAEAEFGVRWRKAAIISRSSLLIVVAVYIAFANAFNEVPLFAGVFFVLMIVALAGWGLGSRFHEFLSRRRGSGLFEESLTALLEAAGSVAHWAKWVAHGLVPDGWKEIRASRLSPERVLGPRGYAAWMALGSAVIALLMFLALIYVMASPEEASSGTISAMLAFNALLVVSCCGVAGFLATIFMAAMNVLGAFGFRLDYLGAARRLAEVVGFGAAIGLFVGAILPVAASIPIMQEIVTSGGSEDVVMPPSLLIQTSAAGAMLFLSQD